MFFSCSHDCRHLVFALWAALAEQMGAKWLFLEAKTLLIPFLQWDFPSWRAESNTHKPTSGYRCLVKSSPKTRFVRFSIYYCSYVFIYIASSVSPANSQLLFSPAAPILSNRFLNSIITYFSCQEKDAAPLRQESNSTKPFPGVRCFSSVKLKQFFLSLQWNTRCHIIL